MGVNGIGSSKSEAGEQALWTSIQQLMFQENPAESESKVEWGEVMPMAAASPPIFPGKSQVRICYRRAFPIAVIMKLGIILV